MQITKASGACCLMPLPTASMTLRLMPDEVVAAHAGLARHAGGDDHHVGALRSPHSRCAPTYLASKPSTGRGLGDVEPLALRDAFRDVEEDDVAEFLQADEVGERAADLSGADERDLLAGHEEKILASSATPYRADSAV